MPPIVFGNDQRTGDSKGGQQQTRLKYLKQSMGCNGPKWLATYDGYTSEEGDASVELAKNKLLHMSYGRHAELNGMEEGQQRDDHVREFAMLVSGEGPT